MADDGHAGAAAVRDVSGLRRGLLAGVVLAAAATVAPARAHGGHVHAAAPGWTFDAWVTVPLAISLLWYLAGYLQLRGRSRAPGAHGRNLRWFLAGWGVLAAALVTPLHEAGERSFAAHMLEHELLMLVAAPLLVLSRPLGVALWAFPHAWRQALAGSGRWLASPWALLTGPILATVVQAAVLWLWHAPSLFDLALAQPGWHVVQHVCFLLSALLFWWAMLHGAGERQVGVAVLCLLATAMVSGALGALMALSASPWYAGYSAAGLEAFGLSPAEDQQLAGLLMWVPGGLVHAGAGLLLLARRLRGDAGGQGAFE